MSPRAGVSIIIFMCSMIIGGFAYHNGFMNGRASVHGITHDVPTDIGGLSYRCDVRLNHQVVTLIRCDDPEVEGP